MQTHTKLRNHAMADVVDVRPAVVALHVAAARNCVWDSVISLPVVKDGSQCFGPALVLFSCGSQSECRPLELPVSSEDELMSCMKPSGADPGDVMRVARARMLQIRGCG